MATIHERSCQAALLHGTISDRRIRHLPAAIRKARRDGDLVKLVRQSLDARASGLDFRPGIGSGRAAHWSDASYDTYAAMVRDLVISEGYDAVKARRIAMSATLCDHVTWAVLDPPPRTVTDTEAARYADYGWAAEIAAKMECTEQHVRSWSAWRNRMREPAKQGRRTRRWREISAKIARTDDARRRARALAALGPADREVVERLVAVLGRNEYARSWAATSRTITVSHALAEHCPEWQDVAASVGILVHSEGSILRLHDSVHQITVMDND